MELSFVDVDDVIDVNERLLKKIFKEVLDIDVQLPMLRMTYKEAMDRFGSDKPEYAFWNGTYECIRYSCRMRLYGILKEH